jgi:hypothetical protein
MTHKRITWSTTSGLSGSVRVPAFEAAEYVARLVNEYGKRTIRITVEAA